MKKLALAMSVIFCFAMLANAQKLWSATSVPSKARPKAGTCVKASKHGERKNFQKRRGCKKGVRSYEMKGPVTYQKAGFSENKNLKKVK